MQTITNVLENVNVKYPLEKIDDLENILFLDIETTGFSAKTSSLYLIGCVYYKEEKWNTIQFFADNYSDEKKLIDEFFSFAQKFKTLIHFNGNGFDLPYIMTKCKEYALDYSFDSFTGIDIYKRIVAYKTFLKLDNCKQKTIERFLHIDREDKFSGGDLIGIYHSYVDSQEESLKNLLLLHNFDDIQGMLKVVSVLSFCDLFNDALKVTKVSANYYTDEEGNEKAELLMAFDIPVTLPVPVSFLYDRCYFTGTANQGMIKVPLYETELKYFYANYQDYYYLPDEDVALHKSVATYVDKNHREKATARNCYTKKKGKFLKEWDILVAPFFKESYDSKDLYFELTDERRTDRSLFSSYISHVLNHMVI